MTLGRYGIPSLIILGAKYCRSILKSEVLLCCLNFAANTYCDQTETSALSFMAGLLKKECI